MHYNLIIYLVTVCNNMVPLGEKDINSTIVFSTKSCYTGKAGDGSNLVMVISCFEQIKLGS